ncbi:hypothetical protein PR003_g5399 [Phytophthora rubi]|uniref:BED-type domain-containing protein n=1 Tax=Phytophthora rubi TaxID=129364 RepID=A0A6A4G372_9STRA|nr:hypothetical protein PR001_g2862 [Phytophthora rubi]KAE9350380.1 hypothetical protein PR003_g5399 [Phytophthora rubi]
MGPMSPFGSTLPPVFNPNLVGVDNKVETASDPPPLPRLSSPLRIFRVPPPSSQSKSKRGRRKDPVWEGVIIIDDIVSCQKCEKIIHQMGATHVERVRLHLQKKCSKRLKTKPIMSCFPSALSPSVVHGFQKQFAMWFYSTGKVSHPALTLALSVLHAGAVFPTRYQLTNSILTECFEEMLLKIVHTNKGKRCTLTTDGWTDINGKSVINYVLIIGPDTYFLESVYTGAVSHDATFLVADIKRMMTKISFFKISAVGTDKTATNQLVWSTFQRDYPHVFFHGCISHVLHLTVKDIVAKLKWLQKLETSCRKLVKVFKETQQL